MRREPSVLTVLGNLLSSRWHCLALLAFAAVVAAPAAATADAHATFRIGIEPLGLDPSEDTPVVGSHVGDAVAAYNAASAAYNRAHGYAPGSAMASASIDASALGLHTTLVTFAPGVELGGENVRFRLEGLASVSDRLHAFGLAIYPLDLALPLSGGAVTPYLIAGGTLRWLDRSDVDGESGGLVTVRAAAGARIARRIDIEVGIGLYLLGGVYNAAELQSMSSYDPRGNAPLPAPDRAVAGGQQSGMIDVSIGFVL
jgi:hypothetical protein